MADTLPSTILKRTFSLFGLLCVFLFGLLVGTSRRADPTPPPKIDTAALDDSWVLKRMEAADKICGPVPFTLSATRDWFDLDCGRPANVGKQRVYKPKPPVTVPVVTAPAPIPIEKEVADARHDG